MSQRFSLISNFMVLMLMVALVIGCSSNAKDADKKAEKTTDQLLLSITTNKGVINLNLFADKAPVTVGSFVNLVQHGYYDGLIFHRVIANFMIQGGCPQGNGRGNPGYKFEDEVKTGLKHDKPGILSMANSGPGTNGSQFFITHVPTPHLNGKHTVFGAVVSADDMKIVNAIAKGDKIIKMEITGDTAPLLKKLADRVAEWDKVLKISKK